MKWILAWLLFSAIPLCAQHNPSDSPWHIWELVEFDPETGRPASDHDDVPRGYPPSVSLDGWIDKGEWDAAHPGSDRLWFNLSTRNDAGDPVFLDQDGNPGTTTYEDVLEAWSDDDDVPHSPVDFWFSMTIGWFDDLDQLYFAFLMYDDLYVGGRRHSDDPCGGADGLWIDLDVGGREVQRSRFWWEGQHWHIVEGIPPSQWYQDWPHSCCRGTYTNDPYIRDRERSVEKGARVQFEWFLTYFKDIEPGAWGWAPLTAGDVINIGITVCDADGTGDETMWRFSPGGSFDPESLPQWQLMSHGDGFGTMVSDVTWGRTKARLQSSEAGTSP